MAKITTHRQMSHNPNRFMQEAKPVGDFMKTLSEGFYWAYNYNKGQYIDIENSVAPDSEVDIDSQTIWGLDLTEPRNKRDVELIKDHIIYQTVAQAVDNRSQLLQFFRGRSGSEKIYEENVFRNLTNAWRDEYCLNFPVSEGSEARMKTAEWRITMCYYALYKSVSAIIHTKESSDLSNSHTSTLDTHKSQFMSSRARCLYGYPLNFDPSLNDFFDFGVPFPLFTPNERIREQLGEYRREKYSDMHERQMKVLYRMAQEISTWGNDRNTSTFFHVFKLFREWANYGHGGIFSRLYGGGYINFTDVAIRLLTYSAISTAEVAAICAFGFDRVQRELRYYRESCDEGISDGATHVSDRFEAYERALNDF